MMFGERATYARKQKKMTAAKVADALGVTLDYLVKDAEYQNIDQDALNRLKLIEKLPLDERSHLFATMDAFFARNKLQALLIIKPGAWPGYVLRLYILYFKLRKAWPSPIL
jgi:transcriptional regulator with XRE-family HTH domain